MKPCHGTENYSNDLSREMYENPKAEKMAIKHLEIKCFDSQYSLTVRHSYFLLASLAFTLKYSEFRLLGFFRGLQKNILIFNTTDKNQNNKLRFIKNLLSTI